jgi:hypothetical protein
MFMAYHSPLPYLLKYYGAKLCDLPGISNSSRKSMLASTSTGDEMGFSGVKESREKLGVRPAPDRTKLLATTTGSDASRRSRLDT